MVEIGEAAAAGNGAGGDAGSEGGSDPPPGKIRLHIVDPRLVRVELGEELEYKVLGESGEVLASGTVDGRGFVDIDAPAAEDARISLWLAGEVLTAHDP